MEKRNYELGNASISRLLIKFSTPAIIGMVTNALYNLVDTIVVGQGVGTLAIAALTIAFPIMMLNMAVGMTIGVGTASIVSRNLGAGNHEKAYKAAGNAFVVSFLLGTVMSVLGLIFIDPLLKLFGATETILPYAKQYMSIIFIGTPFFTFAVTANNIARAEGSPFIAMIGMMVGAILNIILDPIFVFDWGLGMGIRGVALATIISQFASFAFLAIYFVRGKSALHLKLHHLYPDLKLLRETFAVGFASFARQAAGSLVSVILNNLLGFYGGDLYIAIFGVINRILMFMLMPLFGIVQGLQPIVSFNYGAKKLTRVKKSLQLSFIVITAFMTGSWLILMLFPGFVMGIFSRDNVLIETGIPIMRILIAVLPVIGIQIVGATYFQAVGKALPAAILSMSRQILFLIPLVLVLPLFLGLTGIWITFPIADLLATTLTSIWFLKEVKTLTEDGEGEIVGR